MAAATPHPATPQKYEVRVGSNLVQSTNQIGRWMGSGWVWAAIVACFPKRGPLPNGRWRDLAAGRWLLDVGAQRIRYLPCDVHHHSSRVFTPWWRVRHWPHWQASSGCLRGNRALGGVVRLPPPPRPLHAAGVVLYHGCAGGWRAWGCGRARRGVTGARGRAARRAVLILRVW